MSTSSRLLIASLASLAFTGTAFAQDEAPATDPATGEPAVGDPNLAPDGDPNDPKAVAPVVDGAVATTRWPRDIINRVLTLPKGLGAAGIDVGTFLSDAQFDPTFLRLSLGYGITDDFEINAIGYAFTSDSGKGDLGIGVGYKLLRGAAGGKLEVIARAATGYNLQAEGIDPLSLGVQVQYNVTPKIALITPGPQLVIGLADETGKGKYISLPVAIGFQATPTLYLQADTNIARIKLSDSETAVIFADATPLALSAFLNAIPALDIYATLGFDLTPPEPFGVDDTLFLTFGARYYFGQL